MRQSVLRLAASATPISISGTFNFDKFSDSMPRHLDQRDACMQGYCTFFLEITELLTRRVEYMFNPTTDEQMGILLPSSTIFPSSQLFSS